MALSLATTLADIRLARSAAFTILIGFVLVMPIGVIMGLLLDADPTVPEIASRANIDHFYIFLALATGVAGSYTVTKGAGTALVGVMVAVALLPPLVASGLLLGSGHLVDAAGAFLLFLVNGVCVNLSGIVTFIFQGVRPRRWWEAKKARYAVRLAVALWLSLLVLLAVLIYVEQTIKGS